MRWSEVAAGAALALAVSVATLVVVELVDLTIGLDRSSNWVFAFYAVVLAGLVAGGRHAARHGDAAPILQGAAAAVAAYLVLALLAVVVRLAADRDLDPVALAFNALMAVSAGILGGLLADRRQ